MSLHLRFASIAATLEYERERGDGEGAVCHLRAEEVGGGGFDGFRSGVLIELDVVEHEAEVFFAMEGLVWSGEVLVGFVEGETGGEFAAAEVRLVEGLAFAGTALEHFEMFAGGFIGWNFCTTAFHAGIEEMQVGADDVADVFEKEGGALLAVFINVDTEVSALFSVDWKATGADFFGDFISPDVGKADGVDDGDFVDDPPDLGLPVNGF